MKYSKEKTAEICGYIENLSGRCSAAKRAGISYETFTVWMADKPEFSESIKKAEDRANETGEEIAVKTIFKAMTDGQWTAAAWWLERTRPEKYGKNQPEESAPKLQITQKNLENFINCLTVKDDE